MVNVNLDIQTDWNLAILSFEWELDDKNTDSTFSKIYDKFWEFEKTNVLLDLSKLKYIDNKSIWYIADIFSRTEDRDNKMAIIGCQPGVLDIFQLVWITSIIECFDNKDKALKYIHWAKYKK